MNTSEHLRIMYLSGTVSIPPKLPDVADISFDRIGGKLVAKATQKVSAKLVITRTFLIEDVASLFVPNKPDAVDMDQGTWMEDAVLRGFAQHSVGKPPEKGIVFVREHAQSILEMKAGLTAAESAEYYPPLPDDRSVNHYDIPDRPGCG